MLCLSGFELYSRWVPLTFVFSKCLELTKFWVRKCDDSVQIWRDRKLDFRFRHQ